MPQTMFAVLALIVFSLFAVQQTQKVTTSQQVMVQNAVRLMLNGAAVERMAEISSKGYDQAIVDENVISSSSSLSLASSFGPTNDHSSDDDVDDFHAATDTLYRTVGGSQLAFVVTSTVSYADESNPEQAAASGVKTKFKLIQVTATSVNFSAMNSVTLSRSVSCGSGCNW